MQYVVKPVAQRVEICSFWLERWLALWEAGRLPLVQWSPPLVRRPRLLSGSTSCPREGRRRLRGWGRRHPSGRDRHQDHLHHHHCENVLEYVLLISGVGLFLPIFGSKEWITNEHSIKACISSLFTESFGLRFLSLAFHTTPDGFLTFVSVIPEAIYEARLSLWALELCNVSCMHYETQGSVLKKGGKVRVMSV